jgi:ABC-type phosphate transport system substrate-binding protein
MVAPMQIRKPAPDKRVHVVFRNPRTGKSKTMTFYGLDEAEASEYVRDVFEKRQAVGAVQAPAADGAGETTPTVR